MPRSVLSRFRVTGLLLLAAVGMLAAGFYGFVHARYVGTSMSRLLGPYSDALAEHGFTAESEDIWQRMAARHDVALVVQPTDGPAFAFDADGNAVAPDAVPTTALRADRTAVDGSRVTFYWTLLAGGFHLPLLAALLVMVGLVVGTAFWYLHRQLLPLTALRRGVEAVSVGDFTPRLALARDDEIGQVATAFNGMAARVGEMIADRDRLLADVSHELRSPVTRMKVALELLPDSGERGSLERDVREMESLIAVLLERESLRARAARGAAATAPVALATLVRHELADSDSDAGRVEWLGDEEAATIVDGDARLLRLLLRNLVDNAHKFSLVDSAPVRVSCRREGDDVVLRVVDDGRGIPAGSEERLFEPFTKHDPARGHHAGYGLGLDLCRRIARLHGGDVRLVRRAPRGVEAVLTLPARHSA